jgi:hypothetical protein
MNTIESLNYPVLCFSQNLARVKNSSDELTVCSKRALRKGGYFDNMLIVDNLGSGLKIKGAEKLHGVGIFWGYNIFLNQRIKVRLLVDGSLLHVSIADVKKHISKSFRRWHGWATRDDFKELKVSIEKAQSISEIIKLLSDKRNTHC